MIFENSNFTNHSDPCGLCTHLKKIFSFISLLKVQCTTWCHLVFIFLYLKNLTLKTVLYPQFGPSFGFVFAASSAPLPPLTRSCPTASAGCRTWWSCCRWWGWGGRWRGRRRWRRSSQAPCPSRWQGWRPRTPPGMCKCVRNCTPCLINYDSMRSIGQQGDWDTFIF